MYNKRTTIPKGDKMPNTHSEKTNCYTYKVELTLQVLAKDQISAFKKLETDGGHLTNRVVTLDKTTPLFAEENEKSK